MEGPADRAEPRSPVQMGNPGDDILGTSIVWLISRPVAALSHVGGALQETHFSPHDDASSDRKSTRLNSSHVAISYAVFCLKKKNIQIQRNIINKKVTTTY